MKKCQGCGFDNSGDMNFCTECGATLPTPAEMVVPLETIRTNYLKPSEQATESFDNQGETIVDNQAGIYQESVRTLEGSKPKKSKKGIIIAALGGLFTIGFLVLIGASAVVYLNWPSPTQRPLVSNPRTDQSPESTPVPESTPEFEPKEQPTPNNDLITFPAPKSPTKRGTFIVKNVSGWQLSEIKTVPRENFRVRASGRIDLDDIKDGVSAKGVSGNSDRRIHKQFRTGALLMRTHYPDGRHSNIQAVSAFELWKNYPDEKGKIEFLINDNSLEDNDGEFTVTVTFVSIDKG